MTVTKLDTLIWFEPSVEPTDDTYVCFLTFVFYIHAIFFYLIGPMNKYVRNKYGSTHLFVLSEPMQMKHA